VCESGDVVDDNDELMRERRDDSDRDSSSMAKFLRKFVPETR